MTQVTATLSAIGIPPNTGIVNNVLLSSSSANVADKFPVFLPPFLRPNQHIGHTGLSFDAFILRFVKKVNIHSPHFVQKDQPILYTLHNYIKYNFIL